MPPPVFCERVRNRLKGKNLEWKTEYTQNGRVRKKQEGKEIEEVDEIKERHPTRRGNLPGRVNRRPFGPANPSGIQKTDCAQGKPVRNGRGTLRLHSGQASGKLCHMLTQKYRYVKRYFYVLEGQGDMGRRAAAGRRDEGLGTKDGGGRPGGLRKTEGWRSGRRYRGQGRAPYQALSEGVEETRREAGDPGPAGKDLPDSITP